MRLNIRDGSYCCSFQKLIQRGRFLMLQFCGKTVTVRTVPNVK